MYLVAESYQVPLILTTSELHIPEKLIRRIKFLNIPTTKYTNKYSKVLNTFSKFSNQTFTKFFSIYALCLNKTKRLDSKVCRGLIKDLIYKVAKMKFL